MRTQGRFLETAPNVNQQNKKDISNQFRTTNLNFKSSHKENFESVNPSLPSNTQDTNNRPSTSQRNEIKGMNKQNTFMQNNLYTGGPQPSLGAQRSTQTYIKSEKALLKIEDVHVKKFVDYSSKYGLGYLLSNNSTGVYFNDSTKIIYNPRKKFFEYMERKGNEKIDNMISHPFEDYPKELTKKVTLL